MTGPETITGVLQGEHNFVEGLFERFRAVLASGRVDGAPFEEALKILHRHIYVEEEILFPAVEAQGLGGPVAVMLQEHGEIWRLLNLIQELIVGGAPPAEVENSLTAVRGVLGEHNVKEEQILYPSADQLLAGPGLAATLQRIKEERQPESWACRAHDRAG